MSWTCLSAIVQSVPVPVAFAVAWLHHLCTPKRAVYAAAAAAALSEELLTRPSCHQMWTRSSPTAAQTAQPGSKQSLCCTSGHSTPVLPSNCATADSQESTQSQPTNTQDKRPLLQAVSFAECRGVMYSPGSHTLKWQPPRLPKLHIHVSVLM